MCNVEVFSLESLFLIHLIWTIKFGFSSTTLSLLFLFGQYGAFFAFFRPFRASLEAGVRFKHFLGPTYVDYQL